MPINSDLHLLSHRRNSCLKFGDSRVLAMADRNSYGFTFRQPNLFFCAVHKLL